MGNAQKPGVLRAIGRAFLSSGLFQMLLILFVVIPLTGAELGAYQNEFIAGLTCIFVIIFVWKALRELKNKE